jgi:tripartite-type tricarboxylate transporter receptor subunit TctC
MRDGMTKKRTRWLAVAAPAMAASLVLSACGSGGGGLDGADDEAPAAESPGGEETTAPEDECAALDGETVTVVVPYNPGGGFDTFIRLLEPHLEEELEGVQVNVENQPGGGGLIGANAVFRSAPEDLTIGLINYPGAVFAELTEQEGATFDNTQWTVLGRLGALPPLVYTGPDSQYTDFESMLAAQEPVTFGIGGVGSDAYYVAVALGKIFEFPNEIIGGYPGSGEADAALLVGEVDASINSGGAGVLMVEGSGANPIVVVSNEPLPELPDAPLIGEFGEGDDEEVLSALASMYDVERVMVGPPGMDEGVTNCLAAGINAAASNPEYAESMEAAGYPVNPLPREETVALTEEVAGSVDALRDLLQE